MEREKNGDKKLLPKIRHAQTMSTDTAFPLRQEVPFIVVPRRGEGREGKGREGGVEEWCGCGICWRELKRSVL